MLGPAILPRKLPVGSDAIGIQWELQQPIPQYSGILTVLAGTGITSDALMAILLAIPSGSAVLLKSVNVQVLAGPTSQILFTVGTVGAMPQWFRINAQAFQQLGIIPINEIVLAPRCYIELSNISGTTFAGAAPVPTDLQCVVSMDAVLLGEKDRAKYQVPNV